MHHLKRTYYCGQLHEKFEGRYVSLIGWVHQRRDHGGCVFVDLRDREGMVQVVFDPQTSAKAHQWAGELRVEWIICVRGRVRCREGYTRGSHDLNPSHIEIAAKRLEIIRRCKPLPFQIRDNVEVSEETRLRYRYLDLRRPYLQKNLKMRHEFNILTRSVLEKHHFIELETPFLIKSTPEGARDYVVPSRVNPGHFFALPQSPQIFKQLLMISGYDRYFQMARCFRDEDLRAERQPEFTQVDLEMSFCTPADVQEVVEGILYAACRYLRDVYVWDFPCIPYDKAIQYFGLDTPDLRFAMTLEDLSDTLKNSSCHIFREALQKDDGCIKAITIRKMGDISRKEIDDLNSFVQIYGAKGLMWIKVKEDGQWHSPIDKFFRENERWEVSDKLRLNPTDMVVLIADTKSVVNTALGHLRKHVAKVYDRIPKDKFSFCWVTDFPLLTWDATLGRFFSSHHPFVAPHPEDCELLKTRPGDVKSQSYDIVLNGVEIGGGSMRIHDSALQREVFSVLGLSPQEMQEKFGFFLEALDYGAPPHGGVALGVDRILMQLCDTPSIRDVMAFPKTQKQQDLMLNAPAALEASQLAELGIDIRRLRQNT